MCSHEVSHHPVCTYVRIVPRMQAAKPAAHTHILCRFFLLPNPSTSGKRIEESEMDADRLDVRAENRTVEI